MMFSLNPFCNQKKTKKDFMQGIEGMCEKPPSQKKMVTCHNKHSEWSLKCDGENK